jgi:hypothetical protein
MESNVDPLGRAAADHLQVGACCRRGVNESEEASPESQCFNCITFLLPVVLEPLFCPERIFEVRSDMLDQAQYPKNERML